MGKTPHIAIIVLVVLIAGGCGGFDARKNFEEANALFQKGDYPASISRYEQIIRESPENADRSLFELGILYSHPKNAQKDLQKAVDSFQRLISAHPASAYRKDSEMMVFSISNTAIKDEIIGRQNELIAGLRKDLAGRNGEMDALNAQIRELERKVFYFATLKNQVDRVLIEKGERRMTLIAKGEAIRRYKIALGGNPVGPKERQGDNKTPEGIYTIDGRNKGSRFHLSLHISYPNEKDRKRARELGVAPGGDIMIHGIKNGLSWVGEDHANADWTQGCIAVTDEEIEEIARVTPNGTVVEIRP